jgi:hypothetical protein
MTSNLGADRIQAHARRNEPFEELKDELMDMLRQSFRPELLNRIDEIIVFRSLDRDQLMQITRLLLDRVARRMRAQGVELEVSDEAVQYLANAGFDPQYGARPLRRARAGRPARRPAQRRDGARSGGGGRGVGNRSPRLTSRSHLCRRAAAPESSVAEATADSENATRFGRVRAERDDLHSLTTSPPERVGYTA